MTCLCYLHWCVWFSSCRFRNVQIQHSHRPRIGRNLSKRWEGGLGINPHSGLYSGINCFQGGSECTYSEPFAFLQTLATAIRKSLHVILLPHRWRYYIVGPHSPMCVCSEATVLFQDYIYIGGVCVSLRLTLASWFTNTTCTLGHDPKCENTVSQCWATICQWHIGSEFILYKAES